MEAFAKYLQEVCRGFASLHALARSLKVGPRKMANIAGHSAKNISAYSAITGFLLISINSFSTAAPIGLPATLVTALLSLFFIGLVGFVVNLALPASEVFDDHAVESATNKWATFLAVNFFAMILVYIGVNLLSMWLTDGNRAFVAILGAAGMATPALVGTLFCSVIATALVFGTCKRAGKIVDERAAVYQTYFATNATVSIVFYALHFYLFTV